MRFNRIDALNCIEDLEHMLSLDKQVRKSSIQYAKNFIKSRIKEQDDHEIINIRKPEYENDLAVLLDNIRMFESDFKNYSTSFDKDLLLKTLKQSGDIIENMLNNQLEEQHDHEINHEVDNDGGLDIPEKEEYGDLSEKLRKFAIDITHLAIRNKDKEGYYLERNGYSLLKCLNDAADYIENDAKQPGAITVHVWKVSGNGNDFGEDFFIDRIFVPKYDTLESLQESVNIFYKSVGTIKITGCQYIGRSQLQI